MSDQSVARQYANALFTVAHRHQRIADVRQSLGGFAALVARTPELQQVFDTPIVTPRKKRALVDALVVAGGECAVEVHRLLTMLADRDRLMLVADVHRAFEARVMESDRAVNADVTTAMPLADDRERRLAEALGRATGRTVTVKSRIDPEIIGGVVARVGSFVFDGSIAGQLQRMRQRVTTGQ